MVQAWVVFVVYCLYKVLPTFGELESLPETWLKSNSFADPQPSRKDFGDHLSKYFKLIDINRNGVVDQSELSVWIEKTYRSFDKERAEQRMGVCDADKNGLLSFSEHLKCSYGLSEDDLVRRVDSKLDTIVKSAKAERFRFNGADVNADGQLSLNELIMFMWPHNYPLMTNAVVQTTISNYDENNDGMISLDEFVATVHPESSVELHSLTDQFQSLDKDGDNRLTVDEIRPWVFPNVSAIATNEAENLLSTMDTNLDGQLSQDELTEHATVWLRSHAASHHRSLLDEL
ncbi:uncharacterized protein DEA37_0002108 [Paragonimus westermani]|uniref:EF-hand domain-containing protein n=1 Tax=Paragonimus westermani TaxID=34504 RepID=A0A5J4NJI9_9TREM|nr:uncharacterized protein DEA37_0002108 [Paragonimus westermani]